MKTGGEEYQGGCDGRRDGERPAGGENESRYVSSTPVMGSKMVGPVRNGHRFCSITRDRKKCRFGLRRRVADFADANRA